ncbi:MAG: hypothetical protein K0Q90_79 [Paenibacillaceae bacterium]|nr:hypothetical protein [Paenibacillaceae bacterium]
MSFQWDEQAARLLHDPTATKILVSNDRYGSPQIVVDPTITLNEDGCIVYLELLETSESNSNLVNSLWFKKDVALHVTDGTVSFQVKGIPTRSIVSGPVFGHYYRQAQNRDPEDDLSTVWIIEPRSLTNETYTVKRQQERENHPLTIHLDRLAK